jgi:RHS repeat-associated protein
LAWTYDAANNLKTVTDSLNTGDSQTFTYNTLNRMTKWVSGTGGYGNVSYTYDPVGNLTQYSSTSPTTFTINLTYTPGTNRLATQAGNTVSTNANGNITSIYAPAGGAYSWSYNAANRLSGDSGSANSATFAYDAFGKRFSKTPGTGSATLYFYGQDGTLLEENTGGTITDYQYINGMPLATLQPSSGTFSYLHVDRLNVPTTATNSSATVVWYQYYEPYGSAGTSGTLTQNLRFPGQKADLDTGMNYNMFRDYMPNIGRYLEADPSGLRGGTNTYLYASANPALFTDKKGLQDSYDLNAPLISLPSSDIPINDPHPTAFIPSAQDSANALASFGDAVGFAGGVVSAFGAPEVGGPLSVFGAICKAPKSLMDKDPLAASRDLAIDSAYSYLNLGDIEAIVAYPVHLYMDPHN